MDIRIKDLISKPESIWELSFSFSLLNKGFYLLHKIVLRVKYRKYLVQCLKHKILNFFRSSTWQIRHEGSNPLQQSYTSTLQLYYTIIASCPSGHYLLPCISSRTAKLWNSLLYFMVFPHSVNTKTPSYNNSNDYRRGNVWVVHTATQQLPNAAP